MRKLLRLALLTAVLGCLATLCAQELTVIPQSALSPVRLQRLNQLLREKAVQLGDKATAETLADAVQADFVAADPLLASGGKEPYIPEDATIRKAQEKLTGDALAKYPEYTHDALVRQSEKLFPLYAKGERVTINVRTNPKKTVSVKGPYGGTSGGKVFIGSNSYNLADMAGIPGNDGPEGEIAKFDPATNARYRRQWQEDYARESAVGRAQFLEDAERRREYGLRQHEEDFLENERRGYTFFQERWFAPRELVQECATLLAEQLFQASSKARRQDESRRREEVESQGVMTSTSVAVAPSSHFPSAEKVIRQNAEEELRRAKLRAQREQEAELMAERAKEEARQSELRRQQEAERRLRQAQEREAEQEEKGISFTVYAIGGVVIVLVLLGIGWWMNYRRGEEELDVSKFYEGKGKLQQEFWDAAAADPDHFKYVSYLFPNMESAKEALLRLSYISTDELGNIISKRDDLRYGCYEHQNGAVAFIGSTTLNYARWREASMTWPELPFSNYFKVSSEPQVSMLAPDMDKLKSMGLHVESLGAEDVRMDTGEINRVYRFKAATRSEAITLLESFDIREEGLVVRVQTADGEFGKDIHGIFAG
ncbi:MAG: hypothetical protein ACI4SG_09455 [Oligosphaeraceae bacterium]